MIRNYSTYEDRETNKQQKKKCGPIQIKRQSTKAKSYIIHVCIFNARCAYKSYLMK